MKRWGWLYLGSLLACRQANPAFVESSTGTGTSTGDTSLTADPTVVDTGSATTSDQSTGTGSTGTGSTSDNGTSSGDPSIGGTSSTSGTETTDPGTSSTDTGSDTETCEPPSMICGGVCVDVTSDPDNCGKCDNGCPGNQICVDSDCTPN